MPITCLKWLPCPLKGMPGFQGAASAVARRLTACMAQIQVPLESDMHKVRYSWGCTMGLSTASCCTGCQQQLQGRHGLHMTFVE